MEKTVVNTKIIFLYTIPVLLGYIPLGMTYGILSIKSGIPFFPTVLMSIVVFAGSGQFLAVSLLSAHAGYFEIAISSFLVNLRHNIINLPQAYRSALLCTPFFALTTNPRS